MIIIHLYNVIKIPNKNMEEQFMYKILIVDDEEKIREVLAEYAEFEGF